MEQPFYGRSGALLGVYDGLPVTAPRFSCTQRSNSAKWTPSLLTIPQRVLQSITDGDGVDAGLVHFLAVAYIHDELRKCRPDSAHRAHLLRDVLHWHHTTFVHDGVASVDVGAAVTPFHPFVPTYDIRVLKDGQGVASFGGITRRAVTLLGRDREVNDISLDHPSCSSQHAAMEMRFVYANESLLTEQLSDWMKSKALDWTSPEAINIFCSKTREIMSNLGDDADAWTAELQIVDLGSSNGTRLNGERLQPLEAATLIEGDVITFGASTRSYVVVRPRREQADA